MTLPHQPAQVADGGTVEAASRVAAQRLAGYGFIALASLGWGINWPISKFLLSEWPPLSARGTSGLIGAVLLALLGLMRGEALLVPRRLWPMLVMVSLLNVGVWVASIGFSLLWLRAGDAALVTATIPIWVSLLAMPLLGERFSLMRAVALVLAFAGLAILFGSDGATVSGAKLPGIMFAFLGSISISLGSVLTKKYPLPLPSIALASWQIGIGCVPIMIAGLIFERPQFSVLSPLGWASLLYVICVQFCLCYACWFASLARLPASTTAIGLLLVPVIGVVSAVPLLGEPFGVPQIAGLVLTLAAVGLALRS